MGTSAFYLYDISAVMSGKCNICPIVLQYCKANVHVNREKVLKGRAPTQDYRSCHLGLMQEEWNSRLHDRQHCMQSPVMHR